MDPEYERELKLTVMVTQIEEGASDDDILRVINEETKTAHEKDVVLKAAYMQCWPENQVNPETKQWRSSRNQRPRYIEWARRKLLVIARRLDYDVSSKEALWTLQTATNYGDREFLEICLSKGISPNAVLDDEGGTAMHLAVFICKEFVEMMLAHGGQLSIRNDKSETPLSRLIKAVSSGYDVLGQYSPLYRFQGQWLDTACWIADHLAVGR
jgi:hypothetical protein